MCAMQPHIMGARTCQPPHRKAEAQVFCIVKLTSVGDAQNCEFLRWPAASVRVALPV